MTRRPDGLDDVEQERARIEYFALPPGDPLTLVSDQERPLIWIESPRSPDDVWDPEVVAWVPRPSGLWALLTGVVAGAIAGLVLGFLLAQAVAVAAPRSALTTTPRSTVSEPGDRQAVALSPTAADASRIPASTSSGPTPAPTGELGTAMVGGLIAYAAPSHGPRYLALPGGPGAHVRICAGSGTVSRCLERTSTDAGPDLAKQRAGRIADVSFADFAWLCRSDPPSVGLLQATIEWIGPSVTPPATDVEP